MWQRRVLAIASASLGAGAIAAGVLRASTNGSEALTPQTARLAISEPTTAADAASSDGITDNEANNLQLQQVQVFFRHGARTPINLLPNVKEARYDYDKFMRPLPHVNYKLPVVDLAGNAVSGLGAVNSHYSRVLEGGSRVGQLTTFGVQQSYELGLELRKRYVDELKFLEDSLNPTDIYVRSTFIVRTMLTAKAVLAGIFGSENLRSQSHRLELHVTDYTSEVLYPNSTACPCLHDIVHHGLNNVDEVPGLAEVKQRVFSAIGYKEKDDKSKHHLNLSDCRDDVVARMAHGFSVPEEVRPYVSDIERFGTYTCFYGLVGAPVNRSLGLKLGSGPLMHLIVDNMDSSLQGSSPKFHLYGVHDSTIMPLLAALNVFDWKWPPFCSDLIFELYIAAGSSDSKHWVKVKYLGKELAIPGCAGTLCSLNKFKEIVSTFTVNPEELRTLCHPQKEDAVAPDSKKADKDVEVATGM